MNRNPVVNGRFYSNDPEELRQDVVTLLGNISPCNASKTDVLAMVPHAGYPYSGPLCADTLSKSCLAQDVILLGPNHTGAGEKLSVWDSGWWEFPGGKLEVNQIRAKQLIEANVGFKPDIHAHLNEHSLEVILPFLYYINPETKITPICVSEYNPDNLKLAGETIAQIISEASFPVSIVVSSDMSHFVTSQRAEQLDSVALSAIEDLSPEGLYAAVNMNQISMCGVLPMTMGMFAAKNCGAKQVKITGYTNSAKVTGDYESVVAYAGAIIS